MGAAKRAIGYQHYTPWDDYVHEVGGDTKCPCEPETERIMGDGVGLVAKVFIHRRCDKLGKPIPDDVTMFAEVFLACDGCNGRVTGSKPKRLGSVNWPCLCPHGTHAVTVAHLAGYPTSTATGPESAAQR